jgi:non-ribosomal peptide synthetase component F
MPGNRGRPTHSFTEFKKEDTEQSIPARFEQMVEKYPDRLAVKDKNHELTYRELNQAANQIAHAILAQRGEDQEPVALLVEKSGGLIGAILGTLKAGKIYVPLDPAFPRDRLLHIVENSRAHLVLTDSKNGPLGKALASETNRLALVNIEKSGVNSPSENIGLSTSPDDLAYILYTSGSTGQPKGVLQNHRNVLHSIKNFTNTRYISFEDRMSFFPSPTTLGSVYSIFGALLNGGATLPFDIQQDGMQNLGDWLDREEITYCNIVPTAFLALPGIQKLSKIRVLVLSGEAVQKQDFDLFKKHFSSNPHNAANLIEKRPESL